MAITVAGKNYTQISSCDTPTSQGTWTIFTTQDTASMKEGIASICGTMKSSGTNDATFTPTTPISVTNKHLRFWLYCIQGGLVETYANGGIQIGVTDGTNTAFFYVGGRNTYPGGWHNFVVDMSKTPDSGTMPTGNITVYTLRIVLTGLAKNVINTWIDNLCVCDGLVTYGDDAGGYYDFEKIFAIVDTPSTGGLGVLTKKAGVYCLTGSMEFGGAASATKFQAKSQVVVFENRLDKAGTGSLINTNLMNFTVVDSGNVSYTTEFILGSKSGTSGVEGCTIRVQNTNQLAKFKIDGGTDTDVDNFKLYGSTILDASTLKFPANAANVEILNCNFESADEVMATTAIITNCNFVAANDEAVALVSGNTHNLTYCNFMSNSNAIRIPTAGTYTLSGCKFINNTIDIDNTSGGAVIINCTNGSDPSQSKVTGNTTINNAVTLSVTVKDEAGANIQNARVAIQRTTTNSMTGAVADDGGSQTNQTTEANNATANDMTLLPATPAVNDAYYFGAAEPFYKLRINIGQNGAGTWTIVWEYYNGASWATIPDVFDKTNGFRAGTGNKDVAFSPPSDWATTTIQSITAFWVRARVSAYTSVTTQPFGTQSWVFLQIMNELTNASGIAEESYNYSGSEEVSVIIRKSTSGTTRYFPVNTTQIIGASGLGLTWTLIEDTIAEP